MRTLKVPMWCNGKLVPLSAVLGAIDKNDWEWEVRDFSGVGTAPCGASMAEFEARVRSSVLHMSWDELRHFAEPIDQVWNCLLVGFDRSASTAHTAVDSNNLGGAQFIVEASDSTLWELSSADASLLQQAAGKLGIQQSQGATDTET